MANQKVTGVKRIINACKYSWQGVKAAYQNEEAFRQECLMLAIGIPAAIYFGQSGVEYALLIGTLVFILIIEIINSAVEAVVDRIGAEHHELAGRAKDMGSAAVFLAFILMASTWISVLFF